MRSTTELKAQRLLFLTLTTALSSASLGCSRSEDAQSPGQTAAQTTAKAEPAPQAQQPAQGAAQPATPSKPAPAKPSAPTPPQRPIDDPYGDDSPSQAAAPCTPDEHEPDDTPEEAEAHPSIHGIQPIEITNRTACGFEPDVIWAGRVDSGGKAAATLTWDAKLGPLELALLDGNGTTISKLDVSTKEPGHIELGINAYYGVYFYVQVNNPESAAIPYSLSVTAQVFGP